MGRFLTRAEWPLVAAGVTAGLLTVALMLYLFVTGIGGEPPTLPPELGGDTLGVPRQDGPRPGAIGLVGTRMGGIERRLASMPVSARPLRGPLTLNVRDVIWNERDGTRFARAASATGRLEMTGIARGDVVIHDLVLRGAVIALRENRAGTWNYEQVLEELLDGDDGASGAAGARRLIQVRNLRIVDGRVDVTRPEQRFAFESVAGLLPVVSFSQPGIADPYLRVAQLAAVYAEPAGEIRVPVTATDALVQLPSGRVRFDVAALTLDRTRLADVSGVWNPADPGYGVTATGRALEVEFADFRAFAPERVPESGTASFAFAVRPVAPAGTEVALTELDARSGDSRALGAVTFRFGPDGFALRDADLRLDPLQLALVELFTGPLPYRGALTGRVTGTDGDVTFDLVARLTAPAVTEPFTTRLAGQVLLSEAGLAIQRVDVDLDRAPLAALRALAPGLPLAGAVTGRVTLTGLPARSPLALNVRLELGAGVALVEGTLDLTGPVPRYDIAGSLIGVDLQAVFEPAVPPIFLTGRFRLNGTGTDPATLDAAALVAGRLTGWQTAPGDTVHLDAALRGGAVNVTALHLRLATAALQASGTWRFSEPVSGAVTYALDVTSLEPFGPYLPVIGDSIAAGSLRASGTVTGPLDRIRLAGQLAGTALRVGEWRAETLATRYDITRGSPLPLAVVDLEGTGISTPTAGAYDVARGSLNLRPPVLRAELVADRAGGGRLELLATGDLPVDGPRLIVLERAAVDLADGRWELVRPAQIVWTEGAGVAVQDLAVERADGIGRVVLDGTVLPLEAMDARIEVVELPAGEVQRLMGLEARLEGLVSLQGAVRGGATSPRVDLVFSVRDGSVEQVPLQRLEGRVSYDAGEALLQAEAALDTAGSLALDARLPARLRIAADPAFELVEGAPLAGTLIASRFSLRPFRALVPEVRELQGFIDGSATLAGTADAPRLQGALALQGGRARVIGLNQTFTEIGGEIGFTDRRLVIEDLRARSDGWIVARGQIVLERLTRPVVDLTAELTGFRPVGVPDQRDAALFGSVVLRGPPAALVLTGAIRVEDGYVILPEFRGGLDADLIDITRPAPSGVVVDMDAGADWMRNLRVENLRVEVAEDTWIMAQEARVQLGGQLTVNKVGDELPIVGTLQGTRGQYTLVAGPILRRFDIVAAQIRFLGAPQPNPAIDITARRIIIDAGGRPIDVDVRITGTLENPTLQLAGGELASLPESEVLSFLLFGQPTFALGGDFIPGEDLLRQTFFGGFAELAAIGLERSLGGLGLDVFQVRFGAGPFGGIASPTFVVGRQLVPDVFITVETALSSLFGGGETPVNWWAARLDWTFDRRSRARLAWEPVYRGRSLRGATTALPFTELKQQLLIELRRRWAW